MAHGRKKLLEFFRYRSYSLFISRAFLSTVAGESSANSESLLRKHSFKPEIVQKSSRQRKSDSILLFFKEIGFSSSQLQKLVEERSKVLSSSLDRTIKPKIRVFQDLGFSGDAVADLISNDPWILQRGAKEISSSLSSLKDLVKSDEEVAKLLKRSGWFMRTDLGKTMAPNIDLLVKSGVPLDHIIKFMYHFPRFLLVKPQLMGKSVVKAEEMGVSRSGKMFIHAVRAAVAMTDATWELKRQTFRGIGFSDDDILHAFRTAPNVFLISAEKVVKVTELVLSTGKYGISSIIKNPTSLCCSIEARYKPRLRILKELERKGLMSDWPYFGTLFRASNQKFFDKYVLPFSGEVVGDDCSGSIYQLSS